MKLDLPFFSSSSPVVLPVSRMPSVGRPSHSSPAEAAFLCVKASLAEEIDSEHELRAAITMAGEFSV